VIAPKSVSTERQCSASTADFRRNPSRVPSKLVYCEYFAAIFAGDLLAGGGDPQRNAAGNRTRRPTTGCRCTSDRAAPVWSSPPTPPSTSMPHVSLRGSVSGWWGSGRRPRWIPMDPNRLAGQARTSLSSARPDRCRPGPCASPAGRRHRTSSSSGQFIARPCSAVVPGEWGPLARVVMTCRG